MEQKYKLTDETTVVDGHVLHRIVATRSFDDIEEGQLGGWVERDELLSHEGNCWIGDDAMVYGNCAVYGDSRIMGNAKAYGEATLSPNTQIWDNAQVFGNAYCDGDERIYGNAKVYGNARLENCPTVYGDAEVYGNAELYTCEISGTARVYGDAVMCHGISVSEGDYSSGEYGK